MEDEATFFSKSKMLVEDDDGFLSRGGALLKIDLRIYLLKLLLIGLPACRLDLLKNILIRKNLLLHIATGDNQTL